MNFSIPASRDDLLRSSTTNEYYVEEILTLRQLPSALQAFKSVCRSKSNGIVEHFNTLFSTLCLFKDIEPSLKEDAWNYLLSGCKTFSRNLTAFLDESDVSKEERLTQLNAMKMACYLLCQFLEKLDAEATQPVGVLKGRGRGKKSKSAASGNVEMDWNYERDQGVHILLSFIQLSLNKLWDPPVAEEEFVGLISSCCYKLFENPSIVKNKDTISAVSHIVANLIKRYNHGLGASLKIDQMLKHFEFLTSSLVQLTEIAVREYKCNSLVSDIMREIGNADCKELVRDSSAAKAYSMYLVELAERIPEVVLPYMSLVVGLLDEESYMLRNGVLGMMGEILVHHLCKGDLDDKQQATRNVFFDKLEDHIHDVNSYARSKALQIWFNIVEGKCLPLMRQDSLMQLVVGRLSDKSTIVRRHAIQLITALLKSNPFAAKLTADELRSSYEKEKAALEEMTPEPATPLTSKPVDEEMKKKWTAIEEELIKFLPSFNGDEKNEEQELSSLIAEEEDFNDVLSRIVGLLEKAEFFEALHLTAAAKDTFPDFPMFSIARKDDDDEESTENSESTQNDGTEITTDVLKEIFMWVKCPLLTSATSDEATAPADDSLTMEMAKQQTLVNYLKNSFSFAEQVQECIPIICQLLGSKNAADVMEAVNFFVTAVQFDVSAAVFGVRRMIVLIWSQESGIREAVVSAYQTLYLEPQDKSRSSAAAIVKNLSALLAGCTAGELSSMEAMVTEFVKRDHIGPKVIQALWERFIAKSPSVTPQDSRAAVHLLAMCATAKPEIIRSNVEVLVQEGLGEKAESDFLLAHGTCSALLKMVSVPKEKGKRPPEPFRFPSDHELFERLKLILVKGVTDGTKELWMSLADIAVTLIYKLAENPDAICGTILQDLMGCLNEECDKAASAVIGQGDGSQDTMNSPLVTTVLACILSIAGQVAFKQAVHLEVDVVGEMKRRQAILDEKNNKSKAKNTSKVNESEEEIALAGASAEDAEAEYIRKICEFELLENTNLLSVFHPLLVAVCSNSARFNDLQLQTSASLALAKFMIVSSQFCENQLQLLFTILEKSPSEIIRSNLIIALGDLTFRFPNLVEPWTSHLYARLRDESALVRKTTLQVLTHLILNDMVKVKGQISELAVCIVDEEERIAGLAKLFFHELSKKGNSMYNMPDIISRLSDPEIGVGESNFRTIIMFIFSHIEKSKHCESLTEKLCHRFRATRTDRQVRDLSFCLSQLTYTEKGLAKLLENFPCYADKLVDNDVFDLFNQIVTKSNQFAKQDTKSCLEELQSKLEQAHNRSQDDPEGGEMRSQSQTTCVVGRKTRKSKATGKKNKKADKENQDDNAQEDDDDVDADSPLKPKKTTRGTRQKGGKPRFTFDSEDEQDDENIFFNSPGSKGKEYDLDADDSLITRPSQKRSKRGKVSLTPLASPAT